jgi:hypothetical protein
VRRILTGVAAIWLAASALLAMVPVVAAADPGFAGTWVSTDSDDSTQTLAIGQGAAPAVTYLDFYASSCDNAGAPSTHFVATGRGTIDGATLWVDFHDGRCGRHAIGPFGLGFSYSDGSDTLTDDFGITWYRAH